MSEKNYTRKNDDATKTNKRNYDKYEKKITIRLKWNKTTVKAKREGM